MTLYKYPSEILYNILPSQCKELYKR